MRCVLVEPTIVVMLAGGVPQLQNPATVEEVPQRQQRRPPPCHAKAQIHAPQPCRDTQQDASSDKQGRRLARIRFEPGNIYGERRC